MFFYKMKFTFLVAFFLLACQYVVLPKSSQAQNVTGNTLRKSISSTVKVETQIQQSKADWSEEKNQFSQDLSELDIMLGQTEKQWDTLSRLKALKEKQYSENLRRKKEIERLQSELSVFLDAVLADLELNIKSDNWFLKQEREFRIAQLKEIMIDPAQSSAEKFRRIFNALQIEAEYGSSVEVTQDTIELDGKKMMVNLLRIGRLSLFSQAIDKRKSAVFNPYTNIWQPLPESVNQDLSKAIAMARLERTIELVKLPFGRIKIP